MSPSQQLQKWKIPNEIKAHGDWKAWKKKLYSRSENYVGWLGPELMKNVPLVFVQWKDHKTPLDPKWGVKGRRWSKGS